MGRDGHRLYAVLTGDVVSSRGYRGARRALLDHLRGGFEVIATTFPEALARSFYVYRGDGFQGILSRPDQGLGAAIALRAHLRSAPAGAPGGMDARIAIGIGRVDYLPNSGEVSEADGEAFRLSGPILDASKKASQGLFVRTPDPQINSELEVEALLVDAITQRWTPPQAQAILAEMRGMNQREIAVALGVSAPAISKRLRVAGAFAIGRARKRFATLVQKLQVACAHQTGSGK